jgi:L-ascorbate metabolism protein UlaG (beta-lactamase superfamily)
MKLTRFAQSCFLVETKGKKLLVDPGSIQYDDSLLEDWKGADVILVTHKHSDHCYEPVLKELLKDKKTKLYTSQEAAGTLEEVKPNIVKEGDVIEVGSIKVEVVKAVHGYVAILMGEKGQVLENIGYIIDDGEKRAYFTSDSISFRNNYKCDIILLPVCNHGVTMGPWEGALFAKETGAELVIPIHYDGPKHPADLEEVKREFEKNNLNYKILEIKDSVEL